MPASGGQHFGPQAERARRSLTRETDRLLDGARRNGRLAFLALVFTAIGALGLLVSLDSGFEDQRLPSAGALLAAFGLWAVVWSLGTYEPWPGDEEQ